MTASFPVENEYVRRHPVAAAGHLEAIPDGALQPVVTGLDPVALTAPMEYLSPPKALGVLAALDREAQLEVVEHSPPRLAVTLLAQLPDSEREDLLGSLKPASRKDLERLLSFPEDSAGRLMDRSFITALAVLLPVVAGQSGNAGAQALAVTMRGLALREIGIRQWRSVLGKEVMVGTVNGLALAITCGVAVYLWSGTVGLGLVIGVAMVASMLAAGIAGSLVPIILTRAGQDPATASSIILTTITDVAGFFSFLGTAMILSFML